MAYETPPGEIPASASHTSSLAIISLVTGILGITFLPILGSIIAVITGPMAKREIRESRGALSGDGMATAGIVLGWVSIGLLVLGACGFLLLIPLCALLIPFTTHTSLILPGLLALF